jgi:gamma-glutamyltranspeptidase/glutathione hydrolase
VTIGAGGAHYFRCLPEPGQRIYSGIVPNIIFKDKKPILSSGSPSVSLLANIIQNTVNIPDFGIPIHESVIRLRFG